MDVPRGAAVTSEAWRKREKGISQKTHQKRESTETPKLREPGQAQAERA
jgi:hypothetical protein